MLSKTDLTRAKWPTPTCKGHKWIADSLAYSE
jgi:hypothetical protein